MLKYLAGVWHLGGAGWGWVVLTIRQLSGVELAVIAY